MCLIHFTPSAGPDLAPSDFRSDTVTGQALVICPRGRIPKASRPRAHFFPSSPYVASEPRPSSVLREGWNLHVPLRDSEPVKTVNREDLPFSIFRKQNSWQGTGPVETAPATLTGARQAWRIRGSAQRLGNRLCDLGIPLPQVLGCPDSLIVMEPPPWLQGNPGPSLGIWKDHCNGPNVCVAPKFPCWKKPQS